MVGGVVDVVLLDGEVPLGGQELDPSRSNTPRADEDSSPRAGLEGLTRLTQEIERLALWTTEVASGRLAQANRFTTEELEAQPAPPEPPDGAPLAQPVTFADVPANAEPHRSGVLGWPFRRR